jgi:SulP family sulfate permease
VKFRVAIGRETLGKDAVAGLVLGVESVPDGLAAGLLAGVNPLSGLYAYMFGTIGGSLFTSSTFMAVQATSAMSIIVVDVPAVHSAGDQERALFTLSVLTGVIMLVAGFLRLGYALRFVSNSVLTGFMSAIGVNIILGQLANLTGYKAEGANRIIRAFNTLIHPGQLHLQSLAVGVLTIVLILVLERTRLGPLGLVLAVIVTSAGVALLGWGSVATIGELGAIPRSLPVPVAPVLGLVPSLLIPALSLAFVGLVQGAAISAAFPNPGGASPDASRDFIGQGAANVIAGTFRGMPVGGSTSATALNKAAGARSRLSLLIAGVVMAAVVLAFAGLVGHIAMPALAGLLILIGYRTIKPRELWSVWKTGVIQKTVLRAYDAHPAAVRGARWGRPVDGPARGAPVQPGHHQTPVSRSGRAPDRDGPAGRAPGRRGGRTPAIRQPVLRRRADVRSTAAGPGRRPGQLGGHLEGARPHRSRHHVHAGAVPLRHSAHGHRQQAGDRVGR